MSLVRNTIITASSSLLSASSFLDALPFAKRGAFLMVREKEK